MAKKPLDLLKKEAYLVGRLAKLKSQGKSSNKEAKAIKFQLEALRLRKDLDMLEAGIIISVPWGELKLDGRGFRPVGHKKKQNRLDKAARRLLKKN